MVCAKFVIFMTATYSIHHQGIAHAHIRHAKLEVRTHTHKHTHTHTHIHTSTQAHTYTHTHTHTHTYTHTHIHNTHAAYSFTHAYILQHTQHVHIVCFCKLTILSISFKMALKMTQFYGHNLVTLKKLCSRLFNIASK